MTLQPIVRECAECCRQFVISVDEQRLFEQLARDAGRSWNLPRRCTACRAARRRAQYETPIDGGNETVTLQCIDCGDEFLFGGRDRAYFAARGWVEPKRCRPCRQAHRAPRPGRN